MGLGSGCAVDSEGSAKGRQSLVVPQRGFRKTDAQLGSRPLEAAACELPSGEARGGCAPRVRKPSTMALLVVLAGAMILAALVFEFVSAPNQTRADGVDSKPDNDHPHRLCDGGDGLLRLCDGDI